MRKGSCDNTCEELGRAAREEAERVQQMYTAGHEIRAQLIAKGKELRLEKKVIIYFILGFIFNIFIFY